MAETWVLVVRTSLPHIACNAADFKTTVQVFPDFETARKGTRECLARYGSKKNKMFDGKGGLKNLRDYVAEFSDWEEVHEYIGGLADALQGIMNGETVKFKRPYDGYDPYELDITATSTTLKIMPGWESDSAVCVMTNMAKMEKPQAYYLYINDQFYKDDFCEFHLDLVKAEC